MTTLQTAKWTVMILVEEDEGLNKMYQMLCSTTLAEVMQTWCNEFEQQGNYVFVSADSGTVFDEEWMTLEMVEALGHRTRIVILRAKLLFEPTPRTTNEIVIQSYDECHQLNIKPQETLREILWRLPKKQPVLEYTCNGVSVDPRRTVEQLGLFNNAVISESCCYVNVKLSSGDTTVIHLASNSLVLHLKENVNIHEVEDFSLVHQGNYLHPQDRVRDLKQIVEVERAEFHVNVNGKHINWKSGSEPIAFPQFIAQLSLKGQLETQELKTMKFYCVGCQRCICQSEKDVQMLPIQCCRVRSLNLTAATSLSKENFNAAAQEALRSIEILYNRLQCRNSTDAEIETSRDKCRRMKDKLVEELMGYNRFTQYSDGVLRSIKELEEKVKLLTYVTNIMKTKNTKLEENIKASKNEIEKLKTENDSLREENNKMRYEQEKRLEATVTRFNEPLEENFCEKLLVFYFPAHFSPVTSRVEIQCLGKYTWLTAYCYIKCAIPGLRSGWTHFKAVRDALTPLFTSRRQIRKIEQWRGRRMAEVTSHDNDQAAGNLSQTEFCCKNGQQSSWELVGKPQDVQDIYEGDLILICGGGRRTVLWILQS